MAVYNARNLQAVGYTAAAALTAKQYYTVISAGSGTVNVSSVQGDPIMGIIQNAPASGAAAEVDIIGQSKVILGATVADGAQVMCNSSGAAITATSGEVAFGYVPDGGDSGEIVTVILYGNAQLN